jgi:hypothetical protein
MTGFLVGVAILIIIVIGGVTYQELQEEKIPSVETTEGTLIISLDGEVACICPITPTQMREWVAAQKALCND